jgi:demethylmenaquinone methyltransferase / 2-methoxy-6-polyprenyl-1,4-benzoquinol methylase
MQDPQFVKSAFQDIAPRYVATNHVLSLGIDVLWRKFTARKVAEGKPETVLDLATGSGDLAEEVRKKCPQARVTATDFCPEMLEHAFKRGLPDIRVADAMNLPFADASFDAVTVGFGLRNMASWPDAIREAGRVLRPGGGYFVLDFSQPKRWVAPFYHFYLRKIMPLIGGLMTGKRGAYEYLCGSIGTFPSGKAMCDLLASCGLEEIEYYPLSFGIASLYIGRKPRESAALPPEQVVEAAAAV